MISQFKSYCESVLTNIVRFISALYMNQYSVWYWSIILILIYFAYLLFPQNLIIKEGVVVIDTCVLSSLK